MFNPVCYCQTIQCKDIFLWVMKHLLVWEAHSKDMYGPWAFHLCRKTKRSTKAVAVWPMPNAPVLVVPILVEQKERTENAKWQMTWQTDTWTNHIELMHKNNVKVNSFLMFMCKIRSVQVLRLPLNRKYPLASLAWAWATLRCLSPCTSLVRATIRTRSWMQASNWVHRNRNLSVSQVLINDGTMHQMPRQQWKSYKVICTLQFMTPCPVICFFILFLDFYWDFVKTS